ncbi:helix-turn-helix transcriptional regulator [Telmatobacter sp. DSM 110680]|uniref:Helix-turn-helix transcriptional regulator n=1 Tax=Telmatobacter sp. DSM 110680 TaxID=3036704 RepID=A0AAU7DLZ6_9BACT
MSRSIQPPSCPNLSRRQVWGQFFGDLVRDVRVEKGRTVKEAAAESGIEVAEWKAVEAGRVPTSRELIHRMADGLTIDHMGMASLVLFCHEAWEK